ncbi:TonB-dependent receptor [Parasphingopyxis sp.]|uniref:TonB-dependent receptor n=1 Tax=Parasphingopyxis sp. TaxID=1920299 RepID=UPI00262E7633|nr:TonB-dependent receptor [Parasphingopyxis sp.]
MRFFKAFLAASAASVSVAGVVATPAAAQQITSGVQGRVVDDAGNAVPNASVSVTDTRTGSTRRLVTGSDGSFRAGNLVTGGPYTVTATASGFEGQTVENIRINLSGDTSLAFELTRSAQEATIVVTAARANLTQLALGPGNSFNEEVLESFPSITRDVRDLIRIDPRVSLDRSNEVDRISCLGGNDRSNTFTVDGIVQADVFGLNGTPFAARNALPIPFDAIRETSIEFAPFDVEYSGFTGCAVNVVTQSGTNRFSGSAFFTFRNEDLRGDTVDGQDFTPAAFEEKRWGVTLGGPIIPDRLFFFGAYEETDLGDANDFGPTGAGFPNEAEFVTQAQFDEFQQIAQNVYGIDIGGYPRALPESSVRYFGRLDWYVNDDHRVEATYQRLEETNVESDTGDQELTGFNSFEDEGTVSDYYSLRVYSDWSDNFSTELRLSRSDVTDVQGPVGGGEAQDGNPIPRLSVGVVGPSQNGVLSTGPGIFRSANALETQIDVMRLTANWTTGDHDIKFGAEINDLEVFNLFAINATGTLFFRNLDDFRNGIVASGDFSSVFGDTADNLIDGSLNRDGELEFLGGGTIRATPTGDINEAAAQFNRRIYAIYAQDDWQVTDQLSVLAGVRVEWFDGSAPRNNPAFQARYGFGNNFSFSQLDPIILPRIGITYDFDDFEGLIRNSQLTGGVGVFSGGDPVVYFSNAFSNNGFSTGEDNTFDGLCAGFTNPDGSFSVLDANGNFTGFPTCATQAASAQAAAGEADTQSTDPNFDVPTVFRANIGFSTEFGWGDGFFDNWQLQFDYIYSHFIDPLNFVDLSQTIDFRRGLNGFTIDGRPIYAAIDPRATDIDPDTGLTVPCTAQLQGTGGTPPTYTNVNFACFNTRRDDEIQLTNGRSYDSHVFSFTMSKLFDRGVFTENGSVFVNFGYAFTDSNNFRNNNSSTATSSFDESGAFDRQNPANSTSNYETRHQFTFAVNFTEEFIDGYDTQLGMFFSARSGRPYSLTFDGGGVFNDSSSGNDNALIYIPTGVDDPNVSPQSTMSEVAELVNFAQQWDCARDAIGTTVRRNTCREDWTYDMDIRISQEIPGPGSWFGITQDRIEFFADIDNFLNMLDSSWNTFKTRGAFGDGQVVDLVDLDGIDDEGRYIISGFNPDIDQNVSTSASVWRIQLGVRYEF